LCQDQLCDNSSDVPFWKEFNHLKTEEFACKSRHFLLNHIRQFPSTIEEKKIIEKEFDLATLWQNICWKLFKFYDKKDKKEFRVKIDKDTKNKLCRFKSTRVEITHYLP